MTQHPCHGRSELQVAVFEQIATGMDRGHHPATLKALLEAGLIVGKTKTYASIDGDFRIVRFHVPIPIHMQWCQWCCENVTDDAI